MNNRPIALVGYMGAGKSKIVDLLKERGFIPFSGGDVLRGIASGYASNERMPLIELGNKVRAEFGPDFLMRVGKLVIPEGSRVVFDSLRNPAEVAYLKKEMDALVIEVTANPWTRFERVLRRGKPGDPTTEEEFNIIEAIDHGVGQPETGQNIAACVAMANEWINNDRDYENPTVLKDLEHRLDLILGSHGMLEGNRGGPERG